MKNLLTKFRLSNALDEPSRGPIPDALRKKVDTRPEVRDFARRTAELDLALRRPPVVSTPGNRLHDSIMGAIRANAAASAPDPVHLRIGVATAFGALAVVGIIVAVHSITTGFRSGPSEAEKKEAAQLVMNIGELSHTVPSAVVAPLSNEWASVDHDIRDTTRFILASLP